MIDEDDDRTPVEETSAGHTADPPRGGAQDVPAGDEPLVRMDDEEPADAAGLTWDDQ